MQNFSLVMVTKSKQHENCKIINSSYQVACPHWCWQEWMSTCRIQMPLMCRRSATQEGHCDWLISYSTYLLCSWWGGCLGLGGYSYSGQWWQSCLLTGTDHHTTHVVLCLVLSKCFWALVDQSWAAMSQKCVVIAGISLLMPSAGQIWRRVWLACP